MTDRIVKLLDALIVAASDTRSTNDDAIDTRSISKERLNDYLHY